MTKNIKILITIIVILLCSSQLIYFSLPRGIYYVCLSCLLLIILFVGSKNLNINFLLFFYFLICLFSIISNYIPPVFQPNIRFVLFSVMFITFSPLLFNEKISKIRLFIFNTFSKTFVFISFISFIFYVLGITPVIVVNAVRGFQGITNHPNTFAPIAAISFFYILVKFNNIGRIYYFLVLVIMMFLVLISGSRATILGVLIGVLFYAYIKKYLNLKGGIMLLIILGVGYYLTLNSFLNFDILLTKQELSSEKGSATSSRDVLWNSRFKEFMSSPILGIGPNAVDLYHYNHEMSNNSSIDNGTVETGSAWLAQLSMIGILGFVSFLFIYLKAIRNSFKNHLKFNDFLLSFLLLFFFSAHLMFEGNIFAAGSPIMLFFWSTISIGFIKIKKHKL